MMLRARVQQNKVRRRKKDEVPWFAKKSTMQATQWMNRIAQGPEVEAQVSCFEISAFACICVL